ncbi:MAG: tetratricopeptide repeat protein [Desulfobacteraceae bacterium]|nr:tetratricopeptide repeat protein [Desulfobacteraceae bacterium]
MKKKFVTKPVTPITGLCVKTAMNLCCIALVSMVLTEKIWTMPSDKRVFHDMVTSHSADSIAKESDLFSQAGKYAPLTADMTSFDGKIKTMAASHAGGEDTCSGNECFRDIASDSLVPLEQAISDFEARLALVRALVETPGRHQEALEELKILLQISPDEHTIVLELADLNISLGRYRIGRDLYEEALSKPGGNTEDIRERLADRQILWGDFYSAESYWRNRWRQFADDSKAGLRLAAALLGSDRYHEAAAVYRKLVRQHPQLVSAWRRLADVAMLQRQFEEALEAGRSLETIPGQQAQAALIQGRALSGLNRIDGAAAVFADIKGDTGEMAEAYLRRGFLLAESGKEKEAKKIFADALELRPDYVEAAYHLAGPDTISSDTFLKQLLQAGHDAETLCRWAELYTADGRYRTALVIYETVLEREPEYFPAAEARAFVLAVSHEYEHAAQAYSNLLDDFPENRKLLVGLARTLAWGQEYESSLKMYDRLAELQPADLVARKEAARVAFWGKMYQNGRDRYQSMLEPGVDKLLLEQLQSQRSGLAPEFLDELKQLEEMPEDDPSTYASYTRCLELLDQVDAPVVSDELIAGLDDLRSLYEIQRRIDLELMYKEQLWHRQYARALRFSEKLIALSPANQEVRFDHAQAACSIGLCDRARAQYQALLQVDPTHLIANEALALVKLDSRPAVHVAGRYWREKGRGDLADIRRQTLALGVDVPIFCRTRLYFERQRSREHPGGTSRIDAWQDTIGFRGVFNSYLRGEIRWNRKEYDHDRFPRTNTGLANIWLNLDDYAQLGIGYERTDELYNRFGFPKKTQADNWWIELQSDLTRKWDAALRLMQSDYNDNNRKKALRLASGYAFTDHPRMFKATLSAEYMDTQHQSRFIYDGSLLKDIIHPYWTPRNHLGTALILEWRHDLSHPQYCGNREHFYALRTNINKDSDGNAGVAFDAEWHRRFTPRWSIQALGTWINSREWDGTGLQLMLKYRF